MDEQKQNPNGIAGKPLYPTVDVNGNALNTLEASNVIPQAPHASIHDSIEDLHSEHIIKNLRTYQSDIAEVVTQNNVSVTKVAVAEQQAHPKPVNLKPEDDKKNISILFLSGILVLAGIAGFGAFLLIQFRKPTPPPPLTNVSTILATEQFLDVTVDNQKSIQQIISDQKAEQKGGSNGLIRFNFFVASTTSGTKMALGGQDIATRLYTNMPSALIRSLTPEYVMGLQLQTNPQPFIILKTSSYENAFAGMVAWEKTISKDLWSFAPEASSTFSDLVVQNKDVRVLKNASQQPILMYSLPDKQTIVITTNEATLKEVFTRLITSQYSR